MSCFIYKICSLVSFLIAPLGYLISIKYLCRYSRTTEENHLSFILCEVSLSLIAILNILFICDFVYSVIPCDPASIQCSVATFDLSLCHNLSTQGASDFVNPKSHNTASYICLTCSHTSVTGFTSIFLFSALHPTGICMHISRLPWKTPE